MNLPPKPKSPVSLSALAARSNVNKARNTSSVAEDLAPVVQQPLREARSERAVASTRHEVRAPAQTDVDRSISNRPGRTSVHAKAREAEGRIPLATARRQRTRHHEETRAQMLERLTNPIISLHEAGILLRVCSATVRHYSDSGALPHVRTVGGQRRFYLRDVLALLKQQEAQRNKMKS